jgi:hypothetical protein
MAKTKAKAKSSKSTQAKSPKAKAATAVAAPGSKESQQVHQAMVTLGGFRPRWPTPGADDRAVFLGRHMAVSCTLRGEQTHGSKVLAECVGWLPSLKLGFEVGAADIVGYTPTRAALLAELLTDLGHGIERQLAVQDGGAVLANQRKRAEADAPPLRRDLGDLIEASLGAEDDAERGLLSKARSNDAGSGGTQAALTGLVALAKDLLGRGGLWKTKCQEGGLTDALVARADAAAKALDNAAEQKLHGRVSQADSPEVNEHEGRVTFEMHDAMAAFARANKRNKKVPLLVPGPGTRALLNHHKAKAAPAPAPAPTK